MNFIINGFHDENQLDIISSIIQSMKSGKGYLILDTALNIQNPNIKILYVSDINRGKYPNYNYVFSEKFLSYIQKNFYILSLMMERKDSFQKNTHIPFELKKKEIYTHFGYWYNEIKNNPIDYFISSNIPHDIYDYIIFLTLQFFNKTRILFFYQSNFLDMIIPLKDGNYLCPEIKDEYLRLLNQEDFSFSDPICLSEYIRQKNNISPFYMTHSPRNRVDLLKTKFCLLKSKGFKCCLFGWMRNRIYSKETKKLLNMYDFLAVFPNKNEKYFYFPLHYQPELTSCPLGGEYIDQYLIIDLISSLLPENFYLYIKEHPKQEIAHRYYGYYSEILERNKKNIRIINIATNTYDLINNAQGIITITGTAGWEAIFRNKPVIIFGKNFYNYAPNVFFVENEIECKKALDVIIENKLDFDEVKIKKFMQAVRNIGIEGFVDPLYKTVSKFSYSQSNESIINYIRKFMTQGE